ASASLRPTFVEPVKLIRRTAGCETSSSPMSAALPGACVTMFSTPSGRPASAKISPHTSPPAHGDHSLGFRTTVFPRRSGSISDRAESMSAACHGAIAATTPTGLRMPIASAPVSDGMICPIGWYGAAAACRKSPGTKCIWNMPKPKVQPVSRASIETTSSRRDSRTSAAFRKIACRAAGGAAAQAGNAAAAASIALRASSPPLAGTIATVSPVNGSLSSNVFPLAAAVHCPPMNCWYSRTASAVVAIVVLLLRSAHAKHRLDHVTCLRVMGGLVDLVEVVERHHAVDGKLPALPKRDQVRQELRRS